MNSTDFNAIVSPLARMARGGSAKKMDMKPLMPAIGALAHAVFQHHLAQNPGKHPMAVAMELHAKLMKGKKKGALRARFDDGGTVNAMPGPMDVTTPMPAMPPNPQLMNSMPSSDAG